MRRVERRLRLATGLIIACFIVGHFLNHSLGVVSIDAMDRLRAVLSAWWRSAPGTVLLYGSLLTHFALALVSLYRRTTLRMPAWEAAQLVLGLAVPPLLIAHIVGTRFSWFLLGHHINYERMVGVLWSESSTARRRSMASSDTTPSEWLRKWPITKLATTSPVTRRRSLIPSVAGTCIREIPRGRSVPLRGRGPTA